MAISGSGETSCRISPIGKIGVRSSGPAGWPVCGLSGGSGSPGRSGRRLTQCVGMASSPRTYFVGSLIERAYGLPEEPAKTAARRRGADARAAVLAQRHLLVREAAVDVVQRRGHREINCPRATLEAPWGQLVGGGGGNRKKGGGGAARRAGAAGPEARTGRRRP